MKISDTSFEISFNFSLLGSCKSSLMFKSATFWISILSTKLSLELTDHLKLFLELFWIGDFLNTFLFTGFSKTKTKEIDHPKNSSQVLLLPTRKYF